MALAATVAHAHLGARVAVAGLALSGGCALLQTLSHAFEPIPPPWSGTHQWMALGPFWRSASVGRLVAIFALFPTVFVLLEWISAPRLVPVALIEALGRLGWLKEAHARLARRVPQILADYRNG
jgi:hypothetical protein